MIDLETLNGDPMQFGFYGGDITKVMLGNAPPMSTEQFVGYAASTLTQQIIPKLNRRTRAEWALDSQVGLDSLQGVPLLRISGDFMTEDSAELVDKIAAATPGSKEQIELDIAFGASVSPVEPAVYYADNPFSVKSNGRRVDIVHEGHIQHTVGRQSFFNAAGYIMIGGIAGWGLGVYPEVKQAAEQINAALQS